MNTRFAKSTGMAFRVFLDASLVLPLFLALGGTAPIVLAQFPGTFTATGSMTTPRVAHTALLLPNGKVFIEGGISNFARDLPASTELYDPSTGTFTSTGDKAPTLLGAQATLLKDGRVLITGGGYTTAGTPNTSAQIYDPSTGTLTATGNMTTVRNGFSATLLQNGKVLIAGGDNLLNGQVMLNSAELYDPSTGTFTPTGNMVTAQFYQTATLLQNGKVLIADGYGGPLTPTVAGSELYDPASGTFAPTGNMVLQGFVARTATLLKNGKVLVAGGQSDDDATGSAKAELYDPSTGTFTPTGNLTTGRQSHTATLLADGTVLIAGGSRNGSNGGSAIASAEIYDPASGTFSATADMTIPRWGQTATLLTDGTVLIAGGSPGGLGVLGNAELYVAPATGLQQAIAAMKTAAGTDSLNSWQWAWYWQYLPPFQGAPTGFGVVGSITPTGMEQIIVAAGGQGLRTVSAEQWVLFYRQAAQLFDSWQQAITGMIAAAGSDSLNFWQWAWYWQYLPTFQGAPSGFGVAGSISPAVMEQTIVAGGGDGFRMISAEQWVQYYRSSTTVVSSVVNAASHLAGAIAPGELVVVAGSGLGPAQVVSAGPNSDGSYSVQLAGTTLLVNGTPVPLITTSATQLTAVVPDSIAGGTAQVTVAYQGHTSASFAVPVAAAAPGIFTVDGTGQGHAATLNQDGLINTAAHWGDVMTLYVTGLGQAPSGVTIHGDNLPVTPLSVDKGTVPGVMQIKVPIPTGQDCDTKVVVQVGDATSQPGVTIAMDICI